MSDAHPRNADGPFYVEHKCCTGCGIPFQYAPEAFEWADGESHCFVACQPRNPGAVDRMLQALWASEFACIRYRGDDEAILRRLVEMEAGGQSDEPVPALGPVERDIALFRSSRPDDTARNIAERFGAYLRRSSEWPRYSVRKRRPWRPATVVFSWTEGVLRPARYHRVRFSALPEPGRFKLRLQAGSALRGAALALHEWLRDEERAEDIGWIAAKHERTGAGRLHLPF